MMSLQKIARPFSSRLLLGSAAVIALFLMGLLLGARGSAILFLVLITALAMVTLLALNEDELVAILIVASMVLFDWYGLLETNLSIRIGATSLAVFVFSLVVISKKAWTRPADLPRIAPSMLWLWGAFLVITSFAIFTADSFLESIRYFVHIMLNAALLYFVGAQVVRDGRSFKRILNLLSICGMLIAAHTVIYGLTGKFLFSTSTLNAYLQDRGNFSLDNQNYRVGSFFLNPDGNSVFLVSMIFITLGLFLASSSLLKRFAYFSTMILLTAALLLTYSVASWLALAVCLIPFVLLVGTTARRLSFLAVVGATAVVAFFVFEPQIDLLNQHASNPQELSLRLGIWETALRVILAYPITGVGLGTDNNYLVRSEPFRVALQYKPAYHPHNSFLEIAAFAGIPALLVFLWLLGRALWLAWQNYKAADTEYRVLLGGGISAMLAVCLNSLAINGWTFPPLVVVTWLIMGAISSPALKAALRRSRPAPASEAVQAPLAVAGVR